MCRSTVLSLFVALAFPSYTVPPLSAPSKPWLSTVCVLTATCCEYFAFPRASYGFASQCASCCMSRRVPLSFTSQLALHIVACRALSFFTQFLSSILHKLQLPLQMTACVLWLPLLNVPDTPFVPSRLTTLSANLENLCSRPASPAVNKLYTY